MMKKRISHSQIITTSLITFAIICAVFFITTALNPLPNNYYIFQDIDECKFLIPSDLSDVKVEYYDEPTKDRDIKDLSYTAFFGMNYKSNTLKYEIFAYEFEDSDSALQYFVNVTGQTSYKKRLPLDENDENKLLAANKGTSCHIIVVLQNKAYKINIPNKYINEVNELLGNTFSQKLP